MHTKKSNLARIGQLKSLNQIITDPDQDDLFIDFDALERKLVEFCHLHMRNPRSKELDELVNSCKIED